MRSAPLGTPRTANRIRGFGCRRRAGARLLLEGDTLFEDGLGIIQYCRLGRSAACGVRRWRLARSRATVPNEQALVSLKLKKIVDAEVGRTFAVRIEGG